MSLTRKDLDAATCATPGCTHQHEPMFLNAACHRGAGLDVAYDAAKGALLLMCHACKKPVAVVAVQREEAVH